MVGVVSGSQGVLEWVVVGVQAQGVPGGGSGMALLLLHQAPSPSSSYNSPPLSLPLAGGARGYWGGKLGPGGGERAPAAGRAESWLSGGSEPEGRLKSWSKQLPDS